MTESLACMECLITFYHEHDGGPIIASCPQCGGAYGRTCLRTDSTAIFYAVDRKLKQQGKDIWKGDELEFTEWQQEANYD